MVITRQQNTTAEANPSVTKFSKYQNGLKMKELQEFSANTAVGQYHLNLRVLGLNDYSTFTEMIKGYRSMARRFHPEVHTVVASRGIIRVTVTIGDCQALVSSSSEGCLTSQKTVKV